jgi:hypothetical protein
MKREAIYSSEKWTDFEQTIGDVAQKILLFITTAVITSNMTPCVHSVGTANNIKMLNWQRCSKGFQLSLRCPVFSRHFYNSNQQFKYSNCILQRKQRAKQVQEVNGSMLTYYC